MKRAAIVVGSPGHPVDAAPFLVGVQSDFVTCKAFLLSDNGGAWSEMEIHSLWHPSHKQLATLLDSLDVEYSITYFCGHGWRENGRSAILLNPSEAMWVSDFRTGATRQLTIIDACQVDEEPSDLIKEAERRVLAGTLGKPLSAYRQSCRSLYDAAISEVGEQRTIMWGCNVGQTSGENPNGGYFSHELFRQSKRWGQSERGNRIAASGILDVRGVFAVTAAGVRREHYPQDPQLESGRSSRAFPFVVA